MKKHLQDYVKQYDGFLDQKFCKNLIKTIKTADWSTHQFYQRNTDSYVSHENELSVAWMENPLVTELNKKIWFAIEKYIVKDFADFSEWWSGWSGYTYVRFNKYDKNTQMKLHCDHIHSMFDGNIKGIPTLSVLGALNDNYEGGEFIMWEDTEIKIPAGSVLVFPSNFMYPHKVEPVKKGIRYSYVSWVH